MHDLAVVRSIRARDLIAGSPVQTGSGPGALAAAEYEVTPPRDRPRMQSTACARGPPNGG